MQHEFFVLPGVLKSSWQKRAVYCHEGTKSRRFTK